MPDHPQRSDIRLLEAEFYGDVPLDAYAWMRGNAPVYWDETGEIWGVNLHADVMAVSKDPATFCSGKSSRPERDSWIPSMIQTTSGGATW